MKRKYKILIIIGSVVLAIIFIAGILIKLTFIIPFALLANEDKILKRELNNQYINEGYPNWKSASFSGFSEFHIPNDWQIILDSTCSRIINENGDLICYIATVGETNCDYRYKQDFYAAILGDEVISSDAPIPNPCWVMFDGHTFTAEIIKPNEVRLYSLNLMDENSRRLCLVFPSEVVSNEKELTEIAEAIMYSYAFPD